MAVRALISAVPPISARLARCPRRLALLAAAANLATTAATPGDAQESAARQTGESPPLWHTLQPGPHAVGFRVMYEMDYSRARPRFMDSAPDEVARPVRVSVWYPARPARGDRPMTTGEYLEGRAPDPTSAAFERVISDRRVAFVRRVLGDTIGRSGTLVSDVLARRTAAFRDAAPATGKFPVVLYAAGWDNIPPDNSVLCEYLASHGYIVATTSVPVPSADAAIRAHNTAEIEEQARDLEIAYAALRRLVTADRRSLAVLGFSGGGWVALSVAARNPHVRALIGLDPVFGFASEAELSMRVASFDPTALTASVLMLQAGDSAERAEQGSEVVDSLRYAARYEGHVGRTMHMDFADAALTVGAAWPDEAARAADARDAYVAIARTVRTFLDGTVKRRTAALDSIARAATGGPGAATITMRLRPAEASVDLTPQDWARYEGTYLLTRPDGRRLPVRVYNAAGEPTMHPLGDENARPLLLRYRGGHTFELLMTPVARVVFAVEGSRATRITVYQGSHTFEMPRIR